MTQYDFHSIARNWKEFWGRRKIVPPIPFTETSILTEPSAFRVGAAGHYLPLPPNTAGIITSSTGQKQIIVEGGFFELEEGAYTIQYIDLSERSYTFSRIAASTTDGFEVSLTISITYKINDPAQTIPVSSPLQTLFTVCTGAAKNYISTHRHDELIGEDNDAYIPDSHITQHIREKIAFNHVCSRAFWLIDVVIVERYGSLEINRKKQKRIVQATENLTQEENLIQQQKIAEQSRKLELANAEQEQKIRALRAEGEAIQSEILERTNRLRIELETMRKLPDMQNEQVLRKIAALENVLEVITQAQKTSGLSSGMNEERLLESFSKSLAEVQNAAPQIPSERSKSVNELGSTIINLITPPEKKEK
jgi:hypothetical protein